MRYIAVFLNTFVSSAQLKFVQIAINSIAVFAVAAFLLVPTQAQAPIDLRVALVIGNGAYPGNAALPNPANDAKAMSEALKSLGFSVVETRDASREQMRQAIAQMRDTLKGKQGVGMLYYAGHGLQLDWRNYMLPIDAKVSKAADVPEQAVDVSQVVDAFKQAGTRMNIVVLDACRDNPFSNTASGKGLAPLDAPTGTFLAYATAPGNVAEDGAGSNGLYTSFLLQELKKPQAKIEDVFKRVRLNVRQKSEGRQIPWESTSLEDDFFFNSGSRAVVKLDEREKDRLFNEEKSEWDKIKDSKAPDDFYAFLRKYPTGNIAGLALAKIDLLQRPKTTSAPDQTGIRLVSIVDTFVNGDKFVFQWRDGMTNVVRGNAVLDTFVRNDRILQDITNSDGSRSTFELTREGFVVRDGFGSYDPPYSLIPNGDLQIGSKSVSRTTVTQRNGNQQWGEYTAKVTGRETIDSALGKVVTMKVETSVQYQSGARGVIIGWYDPLWGNPIRLRREFRDSRGALTISIGEMISRERGKG
jgi:hypothetical protein